MERTQIILRHADADTLKSHPIWKMITDLFLEEGPVSVEEIGAVEDDGTLAGIELIDNMPPPPKTK